MVSKERVIEKIQSIENNDENNIQKNKTQYIKVFVIIDIISILLVIMIMFFIMNNARNQINDAETAGNYTASVSVLLVTLVYVISMINAALILYGQKKSRKKYLLTSEQILKLIIQEDYNIYECKNEEETVEDINVLRDYNLTDDLNELALTEEVVDKCIIFKKNNEEVLLGFFKDIESNMTLEEVEYKIFKFSACTKVNNLKRLEIKVCYEEEKAVIKNDFAKIKEIDINMGDAYKEYLSDRFNELKNMNELNLEEYIISNNMEQTLIAILKKYDIPYRIFLKDGILFIDIIAEGGANLIYTDEDIGIMCDCMSMIEEILNVFIKNI